jgi:hypothetical protein
MDDIVPRTRFVYMMRNRPPGIGCQPDGFLWDETETWIPMREHPYPPRHLVGLRFLGKAVYPQALTFEQIWQYELWPEDPLEWAEYTFWREGEDGAWLRKDYLEQSVEFLQEQAKRDHKAVAALIIKEWEGIHPLEDRDE